MTTLDQTTPPLPTVREWKDSRVKLSPREAEIMRLVAYSHADKEIAAQLGSAIATVRSHIRRVGAKLGLSTRRELARWAMQHPEALRGEPADRSIHAPDSNCLCPFCVAFAI